jgi:hypothetical protein
LHLLMISTSGLILDGSDHPMLGKNISVNFRSLLDLSRRSISRAGH